MTEREIYWTKVEIASQYGHDKVTFDERVQWVDTNIDDLESLSDSIEYQLAVHNLRNDKVGYVGLDAVNQALQLYGILRGDMATASSACVGSGSVRTDAYQLFADKMNEVTNTKVFTRDVCKKPLMTTLYGSSKAHESLLINLMHLNAQQPVWDFIEANAYGDDDYWKNLVADVLQELFPLAMDTMNFILDGVQDNTKSQYFWTMPDGFKVKYDVKTDVEFEVQLFGLHLTGTYESYGANEFNRGLSPNIIHSIDGYIARQVIRKMEGKMTTTIHDEFKTLVTHADDLIHAYKATLVEVLESDLLSNLLSQASGVKIDLPKTGDIVAQDIWDSEFAIS